MNPYLGPLERHFFTTFRILQTFTQTGVKIFFVPLKEGKIHS